MFSLSIRKPSIPVNVFRMYNQSLMATHTGIVVSLKTTLKYKLVSVDINCTFSMFSTASFAFVSII